MLRVLAVSQMDLNYMAKHRSEDVYASFNLLMRRKPKVRSCAPVQGGEGVVVGPSFRFGVAAWLGCPSCRASHRLPQRCPSSLLRDTACLKQQPSVT